ncbi:putative mediator complex [Operophtera brumata]|uniref:Mediator of RNA polymerase II transcription subunit 15 n=1 Tax=Operophtera brumata TaxID=104452 RepID=A0A0L7LD41_OPEBR|nr:putative mediator complex [Operophtera brumata]
MPGIIDADYWRTQEFRETMILQIEDVIEQSGMTVVRSGSELENHVFMKAKSKEDYMNMVLKIILHVQEMGTGTAGQ